MSYHILLPNRCSKKRVEAETIADWMAEGSMTEILWWTPTGQWPSQNGISSVAEGPK